MAEAQFDLETMDDACMDCFTSPEMRGFTGTIKTHPEDFVVTEIDGRGQLVTLTSRDIPPRPPPSAVKSLSPKPRPPPSTIPPLSDLVTPEQLVSLQKLAEGCKRDPERGMELAEGCKRDPERGVELGCYDDKERRGLVHIAVRMAWPMLMTHTERRGEGGVCVTALPDPKYPRLCEVLSEEETEGLLKFVNTSSRDTTFLLSPHHDRQTRTKIHQLLHELYGALLTTHTLTGQHKRRRLNKKATPTSDSTQQISVRFRERKRITHGQPVVHFVLRKRNIETLGAISLLSELVDCQPSHVSCSGVKDKKAVTTQQMSVRGVEAERLDKVNDATPTQGVLEVGGYRYTDAGVRMGEHSGNHFKILIRGVREHGGRADGVDRVVSMAMKSIQENGFINYFGPQRFGGGVASRIALAMLQQQHKKAVELIITLQCGDGAEARDYYKATGDIAGTLERMPMHRNRERYVLQALHRHGNSDYGCVCALNNIPFDWRKLYCHALSSLLWNHTAGVRVREFGLRPVEGDLVMGQGTADKVGVRVLTSGDIQSQLYSIGDVVLPVLGTSSVLPENRVGGRLNEVLTTLGLSLASFRMPRLGIHLTGAYRKLLAHPRQLSWQWIHSPSIVAAPSISIGHCEEAFVGGVQTPPSPPVEGTQRLPSSPVGGTQKTLSPPVGDTHTPPSPPVGGTDGLPSSSVENSNNVEMCFSLDKGCYATVMLRELMKCYIE